MGYLNDNIEIRENLKGLKNNIINYLIIYSINQFSIWLNDIFVFNEYIYVIYLFIMLLFQFYFIIKFFKNFIFLY